ncbi:MAG: periplasmic heavy metal sensor [Pseudodesulfovibrio sp.]|uniref:periplasmic heavy metal sensor n=1 Tax=Pseudodesulfovibrio sp. TaxID=2035812 RepID=UPI003D100ECF
MKKTFMALALIAALALVSANAMAWGMHGWNGNGYGYGMRNAPQVDQKAYSDFLNSTTDLRASINADRAELAAIMAGQNPDAKQVRSLTERIDKNVTALNEKAQTLGLPAGGFTGRGYMHGGMRGYAMGPGMMGYGNGYGYNCPVWR